MVDRLIKHCLSRLRCGSVKDGRRASLQPCRWLGGSYPDSPPEGSPAKVCSSGHKHHGKHKKHAKNHPIEVPEAHIALAEKIWDYMILRHQLQQSDVILVLGNNDVRVAEYAAYLWLRGYGTWLMFSGELGNLTKGKWTRTEAEVFRDVAINLGVPSNHIILEKKATNTGENILNSYRVLFEKGIRPSSIILVQMPFMERRTYATFMKQWPGNSSAIRVQVTSPPIPLRHYPNDTVGSMQDIISLTVGCLQRILLYPEKGFQTIQDVPMDVMHAFEYLFETNFYNSFIITS